MTPEQKLEIKNRYERGELLSTLRTEYGMDYYRIVNAIQEMGGTLRTYTPQEKWKPCKTLHAEILRMHHECGLDAPAISKVMGLTELGVYWVIVGKPKIGKKEFSAAYRKSLKTNKMAKTVAGLKDTPESRKLLFILAWDTNDFTLIMGVEDPEDQYNPKELERLLIEAGYRPSVAKERSICPPMCATISHSKKLRGGYHMSLLGERRMPRQFNHDLSDVEEGVRRFWASRA